MSDESLIMRPNQIKIKLLSFEDKINDVILILIACYILKDKEIQENDKCL